MPRTVVTFVVGVGLGLASACADDADDCASGSEPPRVEVVNETGNTFAEIVILACDGSDEQSYPLPPPGLADGEARTLDLPAPGCWILTYSGEGCLNDPPHSIDVCAGETVDWVAGPDTHTCQG